MRARSLVFLFLAIGAAALAALVARGWMNAERASLVTKAAPSEAVAVTEVLVAKRPVAAGIFLKAEDLLWQPWPDGPLPDGYVVKGKGTLDTFVGAVVKAGINAGEPITEARVAKPGDRGFFAAVLSPGTRAVALAVNPTTGVSGFVFPGDHVDVLLTHALPSKGQEQRSITATDTVLQDIRVIAIDQSTDDQSQAAVLVKNVTLEATPKQAEVLNLAAQMGKVGLTLRSLAVAQTATAEPIPKPTPKPTYTVDREVSALLAPPATPLIQVVRGRGVKLESGSPSHGTAGGEDMPTPAEDVDGSGSAPVAQVPMPTPSTAIAGQLP